MTLSEAIILIKKDIEKTIRSKGGLSMSNRVEILCGFCRSIKSTSDGGKGNI